MFEKRYIGIKLRENAKTVIGVGVKNSTSDLFLNNCDEFLYYDDLVRAQPAKILRRTVESTSLPKTPTDPSKGPEPGKALDLVMETLDAIAGERAKDELIWGSMIKETIKRRHPGFNERAHGFRSFNLLLLEAQKRGLLKLEAHEKSGGYIVRAVEHPNEGDPF